MRPGLGEKEKRHGSTQDNEAQRVNEVPISPLHSNVKKAPVLKENTPPPLRAVRFCGVSKVM
jgi:hypothetical protein